MSEEARRSGGNGGEAKDPLQEARRIRAFGEELMDRGELTAAAEILTRALVLFLSLERKDEVRTTELLLTKIVPKIGPLVYRDIRHTVETEMGLHPPEPPDKGQRRGST